MTIDHKCQTVLPTNLSHVDLDTFLTLLTFVVMHELRFIILKFSQYFHH